MSDSKKNSKTSTKKANKINLKEICITKRTPKAKKQRTTSHSRVNIQNLAQYNNIISTGRPKGILTRLKEYGLKRQDINNLAAFILQLPIEDLKQIAFNHIPDSIKAITDEHYNLPAAMTFLAHAIIADIKRGRSSTVAYLMELSVSGQKDTQNIQ